MSLRDLLPLAAIVSVSLLFNSAHGANVVSAATDKTVTIHAAGQQSQKRVEQLDEQSREAAQEYVTNERQSDLTEAYNRQVGKLVSAQELEIADIERQIASIEETERAVLPMLNDMVETLAAFVTEGGPMLREEREQRVQKLQSVVNRADVSVAEKYHRILEAYMIEIDYSRSFETYSGLIEQSGQERQVNFLRLGRTALYYQTLSGLEAGLWLPAENRWKVLSDEQNLAIGQGLQIARQQRVPELLNLPLPQPER